MKMPTADQLREFKNLTLQPDPNPARRDEFRGQIDELREHPVFKWLTAQQGFCAAWNLIQTKPTVKEELQCDVPLDWTYMQFSGAVAEFFADYVDVCANKLQLRVVNRSQSKSALEPIRALKQLIREGVGFVDYRKTQQLLALLDELATEINQNVPSRIPTRRSEKLPIRLLAQSLASYFHIMYGEYCQQAVAKLCELLDDPAGFNERDVAREISHLKTIHNFRRSPDTK